MFNPSNNHPEQQPPLQLVQQLFRRHPFACLGGLWVTLVLVGGVATVGLVDPGTDHQEGSKHTPSLATVEQSKPKHEVEQSKPKQDVEQLKPKQDVEQLKPKQDIEQLKPKQELPLLLFAAIALGCAGGSLLVTQALRGATQSRQPSRRSKRVVTVRIKRPHYSKRPSTVPQTPQPIASKFTLQRVGNQLPTTYNKRTQVTVLPREVRHPLDGREESLAELLDLRKHHSLDSLLRTLSR
jgi:hypothetical protein